MKLCEDGFNYVEYEGVDEIYVKMAFIIQNTDM